MITRLPRSLSPWRAVPLSVTKPSRRHQQEIHFHNTAVNAAEVKVRYHAVPKISHVPTDNPLLRARYRVSESNAVVLNVDEKFVRFSCLFLRDSCQCSQCVDPHSGQKRFATSELPLDIAAQNVHVTGDKLSGDRVKITWKPENDAAEPHVSWYDAKWLESAASTPEGREISSTVHNDIYLWNNESFKRGPLFYDLSQYPRRFQRAIKKNLAAAGILFLTNVPTDETAVEAIAEKLGPIKNTFYGKTWDVKDKPMAENVAYTNVFLDLHMDLLYMKYPPGFQLLHCIRASNEGGKSIFADAFYAAEVLYKTSPKDFEALCTFPVTYRYAKNGNFYTDTKVTIELDTTKSPDPVTGMPAIANVNWAPPFQGPFVVNNGTSDYGRDIAAYHRAAKAFQAIISAPENQYTHLLQPGHCVIFNNRRILHGREQFNSVGVKEGEERWLKGAYLDMDDVSSTLRRVDSEGWVFREMEKLRAAGEDTSSMTIENPKLQRLVRDKAGFNAPADKPQRIEAPTGKRVDKSQHTETPLAAREVTQRAASQGTTSKLPDTKQLNMIEQWLQRRAQQDEQGQQETTIRQNTQNVRRMQEIDTGEKDLAEGLALHSRQAEQRIDPGEEEDLAEELALHSRQAEQRLHDPKGDSFPPQQKQLISHAFVKARADEDDLDWNEVAKRTEGSKEAAQDQEQMDNNTPSNWRSGGRLAESEAAFRTTEESGGSRSGRYT